MHNPTCIEDHLYAYLNEDEPTQIMPIKLLIAKLEESAKEDLGAELPPCPRTLPAMSGVRPRITRGRYVKIDRAG